MNNLFDINGYVVVITGGTTNGTSGNTNIIKLEQI